MVNLVRNYIIAGILFIIVATLLLGHFYREDRLNNLIDLAANENQIFTQLFVTNSWKNFHPNLNELKTIKSEDIQLRSDFRKFVDLMKQQTRGLNIVNVEIYSLEGNTVLSTQPEPFDLNVSLSPGFLLAQSGQTHTELIFLSKLNSEKGVLSNREIVISYFSINYFDNSQPDSIVQIQNDVTDAVREIDQLRVNAYFIIACGGVALFLVLLSVIKRADVYYRESVSKIKDQSRIIDYQSFHDAFTKLPNRRLFNDRLQHAMHGAKRQDFLFAILCVDIDRFKNVNNTYGHEVGDTLLVEFSERLQLCIRDHDTVAHFGCDNFTLLCELIKHVDDVTEVANRLLKAMSEPFYIRGIELYITPSIGITMYPFNDDNESDLLSHAETALLQVKQEGGNAYKFYSMSTNKINSSRFSMENAMRKALSQGEFELYYQPFVRVRTGKVLGVEALLRWNSPILGLVNPNDFIPLLEEVGLIIPVSHWVLEEACKQGMLWEQMGITDLKINVNISAMQFNNREIIQQIGDALDSSGLKPHLLCLELTESLLLDNDGENDKILEEITALGVSISLDDFGTGYSSMQYLRHLPIDSIKIDRSFVRDVVLSSEDSFIVEAIVSLAKSLRLNIIAEGVEDEEQFVFLRDLGVTAIQGYLLSRPLPAKLIEDALLSGKLVSEHLLTIPN